MQRPTESKRLYSFTPFDMRISEDGDQNANLQYWIGEELSDALDGVTPDELGYLGAMICENIQEGSLLIELRFRAEKCISYVRAKGSGKANPMIDAALRSLSGKFFFGEVENNSRLTKQTLRYYKQKKNGEMKEERLRRESDLEVLTITCNPVLLLNYILDHNPTDETIEIRHIPLQAAELTNYSAPEEYENYVPCRINVVLMRDDSYDGFVCEDQEQVLYCCMAVEEQMKKYRKAKIKAYEKAMEKAYVRQVREQDREAKKSKKKNGGSRKKAKNKSGKDSYGKL